MQNLKINKKKHTNSLNNYIHSHENKQMSCNTLKKLILSLEFYDKYVRI